MLSDVLNAGLMGFLYGLGPCTLSCAPLIVPLIMSTAKDAKSGVVLSLIFSLGRAVSYMSLGFISGLLGHELGFTVPKWALGLFIILLGILVFMDMPRRCLMKGFRVDGPMMSFAAGLMMGFSFCPPLLALMGLAVASQSAALGLIMGFVFGIGSMISPIIFLGLLSGWFAKHEEFRKVLPYVSGAFLLLVGLFYILVAIL